MTNSNYYSKYVSAKFKYLWLKFNKEYNQAQQTGGYKFKYPDQGKPNLDQIMELSISMTAAYAALIMCDTQTSVDCSSTVVRFVKTGCDDDARILSIIASLFLSILSTEKDMNQVNFFYELFASFIRKKITNCKTTGSSSLVTKDKVKEIISYYLNLIKQINNNLKNINDTKDTILDKIFLSAEYRDPLRTNRITEEQKIKLVELSGNKPNIAFINDDLEATTSGKKVNLGIINSFFENNLEKVKYISYSDFLNYLKKDVKLKNTASLDDKIYKEIFEEISASTDFTDDTGSVDVSKFIFLGAYKDDNTILLKLDKNEFKKLGNIAESKINISRSVYAELAAENPNKRAEDAEKKAKRRARVASEESALSIDDL
jgi:hypothetical protein